MENPLKVLLPWNDFVTFTRKCRLPDSRTFVPKPGLGSVMPIVILVSHHVLEMPNVDVVSVTLIPLPRKGFSTTCIELTRNPNKTWRRGCDRNLLGHIKEDTNKALVNQLPLTPIHTSVSSKRRAYCQFDALAKSHTQHDEIMSRHVEEEQQPVDAPLPQNLHSRVSRACFVSPVICGVLWSYALHGVSATANQGSCRGG